MEYVVDDAREQSFIRYAVWEKDSKFVNYDLDQEDIEGRCSMGVDLTFIRAIARQSEWAHPARPRGILALLIDTDKYRFTRNLAGHQHSM